MASEAYVDVDVDADDDNVDFLRSVIQIQGDIIKHQAALIEEMRATIVLIDHTVREVA